MEFLDSNKMTIDTDVNMYRGIMFTNGNFVTNVY